MGFEPTTHAVWRRCSTSELFRNNIYAYNAIFYVLSHFYNSAKNVPYNIINVDSNEYKYIQEHHVGLEPTSIAWKATILTTKPMMHNWDERSAWFQTSHNDSYQIRTDVICVKGICPKPLDQGTVNAD